MMNAAKKANARSVITIFLSQRNRLRWILLLASPGITQITSYGLTRLLASPGFTEKNSGG
jgi:hypothetical protein